MRTSIPLALLMAMAPAPALALPVEGHVSTFVQPFSANTWAPGVEAELGPRAGAWRVGVASWRVLQPDPALGTWWTSERAITFYARLRHRLAPGHEISLLVGDNYKTSVRACPGTCEPHDPHGLLVGASWLHETDAYWVRLTPQHVFASTFQEPDGWTASALPWLEAGYRVTPDLGVGLRLVYGASAVVAWRY